MKNKIGIEEVEIPKMDCKDIKCPFHGSLKLRGRVFTGKVISAKASKTVTVVWKRKRYIPKYERYTSVYSRVYAYNPLCIDAKEGDEVKIVECRPLSKTKHFVVIKKIQSKK